MSFERKKVGSIQCPRCNAWAELRIDVKPLKKMIPVYIVCNFCKLIHYHHTVSRKSIPYIGKIQKLEKRLENLPEDSVEAKKIYDIITRMRKKQRRAEIDV